MNEVTRNEIGLEGNSFELTETNHHHYCDGNSAAAFPFSISINATDYYTAMHNSWRFPVHRLISGSAINQTDFTFITQWIVVDPQNINVDLPFKMNTLFDLPNYYTSAEREFDELATIAIDDSHRELYKGYNDLLKFSISEYDLSRSNCLSEFPFSDGVFINCEQQEERNAITSSQLVLIPNPAIDKVQFILPFSKQDEEVKVSVTDFSGKIIWTELDKISPNESKLVTLNTQNWANGIYFITVLGSKGTHSSGKLVVINHL